MENLESTAEAAYSQQRDAFVDRLLTSTAGTFTIFTIYIGHHLGFYEALASNDLLTSSELSSITQTHERYVREWLEQQTVTGILEVDDENADFQNRRFRLPPAHAEVLVEHDSLNYLAPLAQLVVGAVHPLATLLEAYRTGKGVAYSDYGPDFREGQAGINRAMFLKQLGTEWLPSMADLHDRLQRDPPARVADIGTGAGWSSIAIAQAYPKVRIDGYDLDEASVELARTNAEAAGLSKRINFQLRDASDPKLAGNYDLVTAFECIHDMSDPVGALRTMLTLAGDTGSVIVMDERVGDRFTSSGDEVEWMMYGWSVLHCLPVGMTDQPSAQTGTVMRAETLRKYADDAGFCDIEILPIDNYFFRFYRLNPVCKI